MSITKSRESFLLASPRSCHANIFSKASPGNDATLLDVPELIPIAHRQSEVYVARTFASFNAVDMCQYDVSRHGADDEAGNSEFVREWLYRA